MKIKMNINTKMLTYILSTSIIIFALSVGYVSIKSRQLALNDAEKLATKVAQENSAIIEKALSNDLTTLRTLAKAFTVYEDMTPEEWQPLFLKMYYKVFNDSDNLFKLWDSWEMKYYDSTYTKDYGRLTHALYRQNGKIIHSQTYKSLDGDAGVYAWSKQEDCELLWEPYWDQAVEQGQEKMFMASLSVPIRNKGNYAGIVACDIIMDRFQTIVEDIKPFENTISFLSSNTGIVVGHHNANNIGKNIAEIAPEYEEQFNLSQQIADGKTNTFYATNADGKKVLISFSSITVGELNQPWSIGLIIPVKVILSDANSNRLISLLVAAIGLIVLSIIIFFIARNMSTSLQKTTNILEKISQGDIENIEKLNISSGDEIEEMANSVNTLTNGLNETSAFAEQIGKGNLGAQFNLLSEKDVLGNALLEMRKSLQHAEEEETKRKIEDDKQNWATLGLAKFGEILRTNSSNIKDLSFNIMSNLINYLEINQGALFVISENIDDEDEIELEMQSAIAYGRDKFMTKRIRIGEELIGRCAFEKKTIYMTDIPDNYIKITSGMGTANPTALLLVPLILNDEIYGVIELASFHNMEDYQIEFVERLGESIASTISSVKVNEKTSQLLDQSKQQSEELAAQEEEMRQNLEELQATQEEAARREFEMSGVIKALGSTAYTVEYDLDGTVILANEKYATLLGLSPDQVIGKSHEDGYDFESGTKADYEQFWSDLRKGISKKATNKIKVGSKNIWMEETYTPITGQDDDKPYKILKIGFDITEIKEKEVVLIDQEVEIKKEALLLGEYRDKIKELEQKVNANKTANKKPVELKETPNDSILASGNNLLDYTEYFVLNITEIDEQHKQLIDLCNQMYEALKLDKPKKEVKELIRSFVDFTSYHFGNEEQYFEQFKYADATEHINEHKQFIKELTSFQTAYNGNKVKFLDDIMNFIKEWLYRHFTQTDKDYIDTFKNNGL